MGPEKGEGPGERGAGQGPGSCAGFGRLAGSFIPQGYTLSQFLRWVIFLTDFLWPELTPTQPRPRFSYPDWELDSG